ncbi:MAG: translation initiation factor IF-2 subunit alpha [Nanoarchaeota archaeon]
MVYQKKGLPEEGELVICTVKKILFHSIFVSLDEYENKEGMIHISEIAPGRIRNIRDYVREEKKIVCEVLRIDPEKGHVDLSLRRVNNSERIRKTTEFKQEQKAEKLLESIGKTNKKSLSEMYHEIGNSLIEIFGSLRNGFQQISLNNSLIKGLKLGKKLEDSFLAIINEKIKPLEVIIYASLTLQSQKANGIDEIKDILNKIKEANIKIAYISAPNYRLSLTAPDYKIAESKLKILKEKFLALGKEHSCVVDFVRREK